MTKAKLNITKEEVADFTREARPYLHVGMAFLIFLFKDASVSESFTYANVFLSGLYERIKPEDPNILKIAKKADVQLEDLYLDEE